MLDNSSGFVTERRRSRTIAIEYGQNPNHTSRRPRSSLGTSAGPGGSSSTVSIVNGLLTEKGGAASVALSARAKHACTGDPLGPAEIAVSGRCNKACPNRVSLRAQKKVPSRSAGDFRASSGLGRNFQSRPFPQQSSTWFIPAIEAFAADDEGEQSVAWMAPLMTAGSEEGHNKFVAPLFSYEFASYVTHN